ncbi:MAG: sulfate ABC transporter permease subunit CysT [Candidatus Hydrogenedentes bacterium]|nr:sulfate ABC transporter permease subunit CysT [Candidatus Hydrogenedentota bacterium]
MKISWSGKSKTRGFRLPGFGISMGITWLYISIILLLPSAGLFLKASEVSFDEFWKAVFSLRALKSYQISFSLSLLSALVNTIMGFIVAWVLVRYRVPFSGLFDALIDLPFALPTAVAGVSLTWLYGPNGWIGRHLESIGIKVVHTPLGIIIALIFVSFPFAVRTVIPVLKEMDLEVEECARCLGARRWQIFLKIIFPTVFPALLTGFTLSFARALGEYGSVIFISGNQPFKTEIAPLLVAIKLEEYEYTACASIAVFLMTVSLLILIFLNILESFSKGER